MRTTSFHRRTSVLARRGTHAAPAFATTTRRAQHASGAKIATAASVATLPPPATVPRATAPELLTAPAPAKRSSATLAPRVHVSTGAIVGARQPLPPADGVNQPLSHAIAARSRPVRRHTVALASLQLIVGYQLWASGVDKLLYTHFPQTVGSLLVGILRGGAIPAPASALLRALVLPNSVLFGFVVEWGETLAGFGLIAGALVALAAPILERRLEQRQARWLARGRQLVAWLALGAAGAGALMGLSFYFVDGAPNQWVMPSVAFGGVLDPGLLVFLGCLALLADAAYAWRLRRSAAYRSA